MSVDYLIVNCMMIKLSGGKMLKTKKVEYHDKNVCLEGYCAYDEGVKGKRPVILVAHDWSGRNKFAEEKAEQLARLGYVGFALDMFGKGVLGNTKEEKAALIKPFMEDRNLLAQRMLAAFNFVKELEHVDDTRVGAIGFCFGGLCVLDLARMGAAVKGIVSFHGLLHAPSVEGKHSIIAKFLVLHGYDDPMVPSNVVAEFQQEMTNAKVDWQMHIYGNTLHAFTNPLANDLGFGTVYNKIADERSWLAMKNFFGEIFQ
jgi:dienelactone hydrolase